MLGRLIEGVEEYEVQDNNSASGPVVIIGPRASGKTTLGELVAARLGTAVLDTDKVLKDRIGETIADLVAREGWESFRDREHEILVECVRMTDRVVSTGGGIVVRAENRDLLREMNTVFYLAGTPQLFCSRLEADPIPGQRPSLTGKSILEEMEEVMAERDPLYRECATYILDASLSPEDLAGQVLERMLSAADVE